MGFCADPKLRSNRLCKLVRRLARHEAPHAAAPFTRGPPRRAEEQPEFQGAGADRYTGTKRGTPIPLVCGAGERPRPGCTYINGIWQMTLRDSWSLSFSLKSKSSGHKPVGVPPLPASAGSRRYPAGWRGTDVLVRPGLFSRSPGCRGHSQRGCQNPGPCGARAGEPWPLARGVSQWNWCSEDPGNVTLQQLPRGRYVFMEMKPQNTDFCSSAASGVNT